MLCDRVLYNLHDTPHDDGRDEDPLPLHWQQIHERAIRGQTASGRTVNLLLPLGCGARDGDVVHEDGTHRIVVRVMPAEVYVIAPKDPRQMGLLCAELGNLHVPLELNGSEILTPCDGPAAGVIARHQATFATQKRVFHPIRSIALIDVAAARSFAVTRAKRAPA